MKAKLVKETLNEYGRPGWDEDERDQHDKEMDDESYNYPGRGADTGIDSEDYWGQVADAMGGELDYFKIGDEFRIIKITGVKQAPNGTVHIKHDWREDGTESKPWTYINGNDQYGRLPIWDDEDNGAASYAEDIISAL